MLKLSLIRRAQAPAELRTVIVLASWEAHDSIRGWLRHAADVLGITFLVVELHQDVRTQINAAQVTQLMGNVDPAPQPDR